MNTTKIDFTQFDSILDGKDVIYEYTGKFYYQHLTTLCSVLTDHYGKKVAWKPESLNLGGFGADPTFRISLAKLDTPGNLVQGFDYTPFDALKDGQSVLYSSSRKHHSYHLDLLCKKLSKHYERRVEWDKSVVYNPDGTIKGYILAPSKTNYPKLLDDDIQAFHYELDFYDNKGELVLTHQGRAPQGQPLEWYFYAICQDIQRLGHSSVRIRPNETARNYFGRPKSFIDALYESVEMINLFVLEGILTIFADDDDDILVICHDPDDDY